MTTDPSFNARRIKSIKNLNGKKCSLFSNVSESHIHFIIEKIISLAITQSNYNKIINELPHYCFNKLKESIGSFTEIQFIGYDRDDVTYKDKKDEEHNNSRIEIVCKETNAIAHDKRNQQLSLSSQHEQERNDSLQEFNNDLNMIIPKNTITHIDDRLFNNPLSINNNNNNNVLFYNVSFDGSNDWNIVPQPLSVDIDRDASTTIKTITKQEPIIPLTDDKTENKDTNANRFISTTTTFNLPLTTKKNNKKENNKKKQRVLIDLPFYDIPKDKLFEAIEVEGVEQLREEFENEIKRKELETRMKLKAEQEKIEKQNEKAKKQKEIEFKNITVDGEGNIIDIKPLLLEEMQIEFYNANSRTKELQLIPGEDPAIMKEHHGPIKVEKNPNLTGEVIVTKKEIKEMQVIQNMKDLLHKTKLKGTSALYHNNTSSPHDNNNNNKSTKNVQNKDNNSNNNKDKQLSNTNILDKKKPITPAGSSFENIRLECGVSLVEEEKYKTGGKDFYKKYKRYSVENYHNELGITMKPIKRKASDKKEIKPIKTFTDSNKNIISSHNTYDNPEPSPIVNTLHLKTKNLKRAIKDLDLITEDEEKEMEKQFNKTKPNNLFTKTKDVMNIDDEYNDMDVFAKTLMGGKEWGTTTTNTNQKHRKDINKGIIIPREYNKGRNVDMKLPRTRMYLRNTESNFFKAQTSASKKNLLSPITRTNDETHLFARTTRDMYKAKSRKNIHYKQLKIE
jgi:hypothetical protein